MEVIQVVQYESEISDEKIIKENHEINEKRKRGRLAKAKPALLVQ
jgi:hypothetical protein